MKILFLHQGMMPFVERDLDILRQIHEVRPLKFTGKKGFFKRIVADIISIWRGLLWCDITFSWFGKLHAFFAILFGKILGKKAIVVAGGDDVAYQPDIGYGMFSFWWKKWCPLFVFRYADMTLSVSDFNRCETIENASTDPAKVKLLYHGFDAQKWQRIDGVTKEDLVLTVGHITDETFVKKGLDLFVRSAAYLPKVSFVLVGPWQDDVIERLREVASPNVIFTGGLYGEDLNRMYSRAKVYLQASIHESFGCSVAEAMLCECVPVVSRQAALPEVVGDCGFYADDLKSEDVAAQIEKALVSDLGHKARARIVREFPLNKRREALLAAVDEVTK